MKEKVKIVDIGDKIIEVTFSDYVYPEDNEPEGIAVICIENANKDPANG